MIHRPLGQRSRARRISNSCKKSYYGCFADDTKLLILVIKYWSRGGCEFIEGVEQGGGLSEARLGKELPDTVAVVSFEWLEAISERGALLGEASGRLV